MEPSIIYTVGHSTQTAGQFAELLMPHNVTLLVDVRSIPRSKRHPQFNGETIALFLKPLGIDYLHMKSLGGLRDLREPSPNEGLGNGGFRGYADYMQTEEFQTARDRLIALSKEKHVAVMCAEKDPENCHRSILSDALAARGIEVQHILSDASLMPHTLHKLAKVQGSRVTYPPENDLFSG